MRDVVEIGMGKTAQRGFHLDDVAIVPSRRTRDVDDVSTAWQLDAYPFKIPCVAHPSDATMSPTTAVTLGQFGGLGVLNVEGLWTRYEDPTKVLEELARLDVEQHATRRLQEAYAEPIRPELIAERVRVMREGGVTVAVRVSPQHTLLARAGDPRRGRRPPGHPGHSRLRRARVHGGRAAEPQGVHRRPRPAVHRRRLHQLSDRSASDAHRCGRRDRRRRRRRVVHHRPRARHQGADGECDRRRRRGPAGLPGRDRRPLRAPDRRRRPAYVWRHRQGARLRRRRGDARRAAVGVLRGAGRRRLVAQRRRATRSCRAARSRQRPAASRWARWSGCCSARPTIPRAA